MKLPKRKDVYWVFKAKPSFKIPPGTPMFVNQSLCWYYKFLWSKCKQLWLNKVIEIFWVSKGSCRISLVGKPVKAITHIDEWKILFPGSPILEENWMLLIFRTENALFKNIPVSCQSPVTLDESVFSKSNSDSLMITWYCQLNHMIFASSIFNIFKLVSILISRCCQS